MSSSPQTRWQDPFTVRLGVKDPHVRLHCVIIAVSDQDRSLKFYIEQLGFTLAVDAMIGPEVRWIEVAPPDGSGLLALVKADGQTAGEAGQSRHVVFVTDDVEGKYNEWSARGVYFSKSPGRPGWSPDAGTFATFEDPDGNSFSLINFDEITRDIDERRRTLAERLEAERRNARELEIAKEVQARLFPQTLPAMRTLGYAGLCIQARQVGGDYFDFLSLGNERLGMVVGDISGKGIAAALLMANLQANLRSQLAAIDQPQRLLRSVNQLFHDNTIESAYATLFFGEYDDATRVLRYANCGHLPAMLLRSDGSLEWLESTCTVIGLFSGWECAIEERQLRRGDTLVLYTDGVTEAFDEQGEEFGEHRLIDAVRRNENPSADIALKAVADEVRAFAPQEQHDDITLIVAKCR